MLLNDNDYSLQTISDKTNISIENLEKLSNKEWDKFKRTQAIGLITIIEREFNEDLSDLKEEAIAYFKEHTKKEPDRPIDLVDAASVSGGGSRVISNIITIVTLCAIGYAGWYYFAEDKTKTVGASTNITDENSNKGMFASTIESVKNLLSSNKNETTKVLKEANSSKNENTQEQTETVNETSTNAPQESKTQEPTNSSSEPKKFDITSVPSSSANSNSSESSNSNNSSENKEVVAVVNPENKANSQESEAKEQTQEVSTHTQTEAQEQTTTQSSTESSQSSNSEVNDSNTDKTEVGKLLNELDNSKQTTQEQESVEVNSSEVTQDDNTTQADTNSSETASAITTAQVNLKSKKLWLGIYNLTTKKRTVKVIKKPLDLEVGNDEYAIVTGHNKFEIVTNNGVKKFKKRGKVYFKLSKDGIEELSRQEYRVLTKKRAW